ncbi:MAG: DUF1573 domain-containing protein [Culturomica sp.]|jgi:hypothetical protein|nr:DUF1573 domain-containing protein [Culturomica sp.]
MKIYAIAIMMLLFGNINAQGNKGVVTFEKTEINLGKVYADDVQDSFTFKFKNTGTAPVIINRVRATAPQTVAEWDRNPVLPGNESQITIKYVSSALINRNSFNVNVYSNAENGNAVISAHLSLVDNPKKPYLLYVQNLDSVKFQTTNVNFGKVYIDKVAVDTVYFYNTKSRDLHLTNRYIPRYITTTYVPEVVKPGEKGMIIVKFDAKAKNDYGYTYDNVIIRFNNSDSYNNRLAISANVAEDFSSLSAKEIADAPVAAFDKTSISFGTIKSGVKADCDFVLKNEGKSNLIVRKTKAGCGCTAVTMGNNTIKPGESTVIRATFNSANRKGSQHKSVTVITNDPKTPETQLTITGDVE